MASRHVLLLLPVLLALAPMEAAADSLSEMASFRETFDTDTLLEGAVKLGQVGPWQVTLEDGVLTHVNDSDNSVLRFYDFPSLNYPFGIGKESTDGAEPSARVRVDETQNGGAGLLVGFPRGGDYLGFTIGDDQTFLIVQKSDGKLRRLEDGTNSAIKPGAFNHLAVARMGAKLAFMVNGVEIFSIDNDAMADAPVGIAVFGRGTFVFDEVTIEPPARVLSSRRTSVNRCSLPPAEEDDMVALIGVYEGATASSVTLVGQDKGTGTIAIQLAPGTGGIYVVVSALNPTVWRFEGDTDRLSHVAIVGVGGALGVPAEKLSFHEPNRCFRHFYGSGRETESAQRTVALALGRVDLVLSDYDPAGFDLPSGDVVPGDAAVPVGLDPRWTAARLLDILRFTPGGILDIDPADVIAAGPVESYKIMPAEFGIAQILTDGIAVTEARSTFRLVRPLPRFPAGLGGAHSVTFLLDPGVPLPFGDPGHSRIIADTTFTPGIVPRNVSAVPYAYRRLDVPDGTFAIQDGLQPQQEIVVCGPLATGEAERLQSALDAYAPGIFNVAPMREPNYKYGTTVVYFGDVDPSAFCGRPVGSQFNAWMERQKDRVGDDAKPGCSYSRIRVSNFAPFLDFAFAFAPTDGIGICFDRFVTTLLGLGGNAEALWDPDQAQVVRALLATSYRPE